MLKLSKRAVQFFIECNICVDPKCNKCVQGKRIVAFVVGGVTRSEMRVAHKLSAKLGREILIGSTSCDTPTSFLKSLQVW